MSLPDPSAYAARAFPHPLRRHQREALEALAAVRAAGRRRAWVVLPPGAGKTLVGLETIRREGVRALVLSPNTAIQGQWVRGWEAFEGPPVSIGSDRELSAAVTSLTYQSLAVFDAEADDEGPTTSELERLHENGRALIAALQEAGPITLVLDECHHLLEVWGRLLAEILEELPEATVLGLTATPPDTLGPEQAELVAELFGDIVYATSIPAVVREGHLAPFMDLIWLTTPSAAEADWLAGQAERFAELTTQLLDPAFGSKPFLVWADLRFHGEVPFARIAAKQPALADAALRLAHAGLLRLPDDVARGEAHAHPPTADDWAVLIDDWYDACVVDSVDDRDQDVREVLKRALPSIGFSLTRAGIRRGRTAVDRVLARSAAKSAALVEIVSAEHRSLGDRMGMLVICDHEEAAATVSADLAGVLQDRAGSARLALAQLLADPATTGLAPLMVTGKTVAAAPAVLERLRGECGVSGLVVGEPDGDGIAELTGPWSSREWVRAVTDFFTGARCQVLIGTRALLGEGWDAPTATGLVDLSMASTPGAVVQTRGRTLRLDPRDPQKVAVNWTVCCVAEGHPKGDNDWQRTVRKHQGYFGVDATGDIVDGVAHIHPSFSPHAPPAAATFSATNAEMLVRAEHRAEVLAAWRVGTPYDDEVRHTVWMRLRRPGSGTRGPRRGGRDRAAGDGAARARGRRAEGAQGMAVHAVRDDRGVGAVVGERGRARPARAGARSAAAGRGAGGGHGQAPPSPGSRERRCRPDPGGLCPGRRTARRGARERGRCRRRLARRLLGAAAGRVRPGCGRDGPERGVRRRARRDGGPDRGAALPGAALRRRPGQCIRRPAAAGVVPARPRRVAPGAIGAGRPGRARRGVRDRLGALGRRRPGDLHRQPGGRGGAGRMPRHRSLVRHQRAEAQLELSQAAARTSISSSQAGSKISAMTTVSGGTVAVEDLGADLAVGGGDGPRAEVRRHLDDVADGHARGGQHRVDVRPDHPALLLGRFRHLTAQRLRSLPADQQPPTRVRHLEPVRVAALRGGDVGGIVAGERGGHVATLARRVKSSAQHHIPAPTRMWHACPDELIARVLWGRCNSEPAVTDREPSFRSPRPGHSQ